MKRLLSLITALLILLVPVLAFASDFNTVRIEEYGITLDFPCPEGWYIFSRDMAEDDPQFEAFGLTYESVIKGFESSGIYYNSASPDKTKEYTLNIEVTDKTETIHNYNLLVESKFEKMAQKVVDTNYTKNLKGLSYSGYEIVKGDPASWIVLTGRIEKDVKNGDATVHYATNLLDYNTVVNGVNIHLTYHSTEDITDEEKAMLKAAVDSLRWDEIKERDLSSTGVWKKVLIGGGLALALALLLIPHIRSYNKKRQKKIEEAMEKNRRYEEAKARREAAAQAFIKEMGLEDEVKAENGEAEAPEEPEAQDGDKTE